MGAAFLVSALWDGEYSFFFAVEAGETEVGENLG